MDTDEEGLRHGQCCTDMETMRIGTAETCG